MSYEEINMMFNALQCLITFGLGWMCCLVFNWVTRAIRMEKNENNKIQEDS
jgi:hypothetical protein